MLTIKFHITYPTIFLKHLKNVEAVANESDPQTWSDLYEIFLNNYGYSNPKFYKDFYLLSPKKQNLIGLFDTQTNYFKNMLSGNNGINSDYQEDTVLDMFIFQTGKKLGKKVVGLEDAIESYVPIFKLSDKEAEPDEESKSALAKLLNNRSFDNALKDYYREKNYVLLDSIYKLIISPKAHDALIVKRNIDMANSMDSIMKNNSLFAAVGAAHLGGKQGMLQLLEEKGYTVKPVISTLTNKGEELKEEFETNFPKPTLHNHSTKDGFISFKANELVYDDNNGLSSPDYTNGANLKISRVFLNNFLKKKIGLPKNLLTVCFLKTYPEKHLQKILLKPLLTKNIQFLTLPKPETISITIFILRHSKRLVFR